MSSKSVLIIPGAKALTDADTLFSLLRYNFRKELAHVVETSLLAASILDLDQKSVMKSVLAALAEELLTSTLLVQASLGDLDASVTVKSDYPEGSADFIVKADVTVKFTAITE